MTSPLPQPPEADTAAVATPASSSRDDEMGLDDGARGGGDENETPIRRRPRSDSAGLDALAALASQAQASLQPEGDAAVAASSSDSDVQQEQQPSAPFKKEDPLQEL